MYDTPLPESPLFANIPLDQLRAVLSSSPHRIKHYEKGETIFHLLDNAVQVGIVLEGSVEAQKAFPNGGQINVSLFGPGEVIGAAAVFSASKRYPCDIVAVEPCAVMLFEKEAILTLMQRDQRILENMMTEIASAATMLQQRLELLSYKGIAQKAAFWLLTQSRQRGSDVVKIPESVSKWAMMLDVSRPSLHRELKKLETRGFITYQPPMILIDDLEGLAELLGET